MITLDWTQFLTVVIIYLVIGIVWYRKETR